MEHGTSNIEQEAFSLHLVVPLHELHSTMKTRFLFALVILLAASQITLGQKIAIKAGHVVDPATGTSAENQIIIINGKTIEAVGANLDTSDAEMIDLSDSWVLPGLMDAHAHMTFGVPPYFNTGNDWEMYFLKESTAYRALRGLKQSMEALESGFTTIKDIGNDANYAMVDVRKAIEFGYFVGPTLLNSGKIIAAFGGQSRGFSPEQGPFWQYEYLDADSPDEVRKAVRENIYYGANTIKLVADNSNVYYTVDEIKAAVEEAHRAGLTISIHVYGGPAADNVIAGDPESIEHGFNLTDAQLTKMKAQGMYLVGTDFPEEHFRMMGSSDEEAKAIAHTVIDRLARAHKIGTKMAFGTDVIIDHPDRTRGELMLDYLDVWKAAGIPAPDILKALTTNAAELMAISNDRGAIKAGLHADIIATPENPLADVNTLKHVSFVMKDGHLVKGM